MKKSLQSGEKPTVKKAKEKSLQSWRKATVKKQEEEGEGEEVTTVVEESYH